MSNSRFVPALTNIPLLHQGKTRDTFQANDGNLLIVATRRLSTHNIIHESEVPLKGEVLTALTVFWLTGLMEAARIKHHLIADGVRIFNHLPGSRSDYPADLHRRAIVVRKLEMIPVEFIWRGYLSGSFYKQYYSQGLPNPYGIDVKKDLQLMARFPNPIFTPTDKSETDEPLNSKETKALYPKATRQSELAFRMVRAHLQGCGLELVDSKFEIGLDADGDPVIADEIVTPDSSRFCALNAIRLGVEPPWFDKQVARDQAEQIWGSGKKRALTFAPEVIERLSGTYLDIFSRITGSELEDFQRDRLDR
jgi:phosphoribosylaminoimidazole-succinocarboxamide synthase